MNSWPLKLLGEITKNLDSRRVPLNGEQRNQVRGEGTYPYFGANGIVDRIDKYIFDERILCVAEDGGSWGKDEKCSYIVDEKCWVNNHAHVLTARNGLSLDYLKYYLTGTTRGKLTRGALNRIPIPLPPLEEQRRIAEVLDRADALRQKRRLALQKLDTLLQSVFLDMFGDPVKNPKEWAKEKMGDLMVIRRGGSPRPIDNFLGGEFNWIKIGDATKGNQIYLDSSKEKIIREGLKKTVFLKSGSLIFANCGVSLGFARILRIDGCIHDGWLSFEEIPQDKINKIFLLKALNNITEHFRAIAPSGTQPNLNTGIMKTFPMIVPPLDLQTQFASMVERVEKIRSAKLSAEQVTTRLFQSVQQRAFNGELFQRPMPSVGFGT